ncbi:MAG TPA: ChrR family anti-sigma-E factor [Rhizomicrobium sp.]|nr:ChrR family anti-sigma-E factor [Rhizomicrobium sp.]
MIRHHPSGAVLARYSAGSIDPGAALAVGLHVDGCSQCRSEVAFLNGLGGSLLARTDPVSISEGALEHMLARLDKEPLPARSPAARPDFLSRFDLPRRLQRIDIGSRQWLAPGIWFAPVEAEPGSASRTYLLYGAKGKMLPRHTHPGKELTVVLNGAYIDDLGRFSQGDFAEADETISHAQQVTDDGECLCLITSAGPMKPEGLIARAVQIFAGRRY